MNTHPHPLSFNEITFIPLTPDLTVDYSRFDCGDEDLNDFLRNDALPESLKYFSSTHLAIYHGEVIGFFTLVTDTIHLKQQMRDTLSIDYPYGRQIPAIKIARLARSLKYRGYGVGKLLMKKIIHIAYETSANIAFRILSVDAKNTDEAFRLYYESGFMQGQTRPDHETAFYLDVAPVFTALKEQRKSAT